MNVSEARRVIDPETKTKDVLKIGEKYRMGPSGTSLEARKIAARIMEYAIDKKPDLEYSQGGEATAYCPRCKADITEGYDSWEYCPFCGQAVCFQEYQGEWEQ